MTDLRKRLGSLPVFPLLVLVLAICTPAGLHAAEAGGPPSEGAKKCGELEPIEFKPDDWTGRDSWWRDSDGVDPGTAGCHEGLKEGGQPNGRSFGEVCRNDVVLVETNPDPGVRHSHKNDIGHPDVFDCMQWCACQGFAKGGFCSKVRDVAPPCTQSAKCVCSN